MQYIIWGAGERGCGFLEALPSREKTKIIAFYDNDKWTDGRTILDKLIVYSGGADLNLEDTAIIIPSYNYAISVYRQLRQAGSNIPLFLLKYHDAFGGDKKIWSMDKLYGKSAIEEVIVPFPEGIDYSLPELKSLDVDIVDHCNLNCRGCGHLSNVAKKRVMSFDVFYKDISRISELYRKVNLLQLLGGEPLLHPEFDRFIECARNMMPLSDICVYSNGLLISSVPSKYLEAMRVNRVYFRITQYPPVSKVVNQIKDRLDKSGVAYYISDLRDKFFAGLQKKPHDVRMSFAKCPHRCYSLYNGFISCCTGDVLLDRNREFLPEPIAELKNGKIDIYDKDLTGEILNRLLEMPVPMCEYCEGADPRKFNWSCGGTPEQSDWLCEL